MVYFHFESIPKVRRVCIWTYNKMWLGSLGMVYIYICILYIHIHTRLTFGILSKWLPSKIGQKTIKNHPKFDTLIFESIRKVRRVCICIWNINVYIYIYIYMYILRSWRVVGSVQIILSLFESTVWLLLSCFGDESVVWWDQV